MAIRIQLRRDTAANWVSVNPTLLNGEIGIETDTLKFKIGNGNRWNTISSYAFKVGEADGIATLNSEGKIPLSQLPTTLSIVADINAAFASMTTSDITEGNNLYFTDARAVAAVAEEISQEVAQIITAIATAKSEAVTISTTDATNKAAAAQLNAISAAETKDQIAISTAVLQASEYTNFAISEEVTNRNAAITSSITSEISNRNNAISAAIAQEVTNRNAAISQEVTDRNSAISSAIATEVTNRNAAIAANSSSVDFNSKTTDDLTEGSSNLYFTESRVNSILNPRITDVIIALNDGIDGLSASLSSTFITQNTADSRYVLTSGLQNSLDQYVLESGRNAAFGYAGLDENGLLLTSVIPNTISRATDVTSAISLAINTETTNRNTAIDAAINNLIGSAPSTLDTLQEIATLVQSGDSTLTALTSTVALKAPINSPTFTGTVSGITKTMVGLGNVDNTSDLNKPISTLTQSALDLKAPLESPIFTGTIDFSAVTVTGLDSILPSQSGYTGRFLRTDGSSATWEDVFPYQGGSNGKFLTTDGTNTSWASIDLSSYATSEQAQSYGYHNISSGTTANKIAYGTSATGYTSISSPAAGDIYIQY